MHKIVFVSTYSFAEPVVKNRLTPFIDLALNRGYSVKLVTPAGGIYHRARERNFSHETIEISQANRRNFFVRSLREWRLTYKILDQIPDNYDVLFVTIPSMFLLFMFRGFNNSLKILDIRDLTWEYLSDNSFITRCAKLVFRFLAQLKVSHFDFFCVTNSAEWKYLTEQFNITPEKITHCSNGISMQQFYQLTQVDYHSTSKIFKRTCVSYIGNIGIAQNLITLIQVAKQHPEVDFMIVGGGTDQTRIIEASKNLPNVEMVGRVEWHNVLSAYQKADLLWAQLLPEFSGAVPSKLYEYLATGKRVIYGGCGEAIKTISEFDDVQIIEPNNVQALSLAIKQALIHDQDFVINFNNRKKIEEKYLRELYVKLFYQRIFER